MIHTYQKKLSGKNVGIVFGTFAPLHQGHLDVIMRAKKECDGGCLVIVDGRDNDRGGRMKVIIDIPTEFKNDYKTDKFKDFFSRVIADIDCDGLCGNYEKETAEMFRDAFENGEIYDEQDIYLEAYKEGQNKGLSDGRFLGKIEAENNNGWIYCNEEMPLLEKEVLIVAKRKFRDGSFKYIITSAMYEDGTILENDSCWYWYDIEGEWDEEEDCYIIPEGWWENKHYNPDECYNNQVDDEVIAWQYLPEYCEEKGGE